MNFFRAPLAIIGFLVSLAASARWGVFAGLAVFTLFSAALAPRDPVKCFANNFGVLNNTIVVYDAFKLFLENLLPLRNLVLDVQGENGVRTGKPGDVITVKDWRTTVTPYQPAPTYTPQDINISAGDRQLTLPNAAWAVSFQLTAAEFRLISGGATGGAEYDAFRTKLRSLMVNGLGKKVIDLMFAVVTTANFPDVPCETINAIGAFTRSVEIDLDTTLFSRNVPSEGAMVICSPVLFGEWAKDHIAIQTNTADNRQQGLLMQGGVRSQNSNFTFWRTNRPMPAEADRGFALASTGIIGAFRIPDEATFENDPVSLMEIVDPVTGIPMLARLWKNPGDGAIQMDLATLPVFGRGQIEALQRIDSTGA